MTYNEVMAELKKMGTTQNAKVYRRHGAGDNLFGVSFANLNKLKKKIKSDQGLAEQLWDSGNMDAKTLATMIADPARMKPAIADGWVKDIDYYLLADMAADTVAKSSFADKKMKQWMKSKKEYIRQCGYATALRCRLLTAG